MSRKVKRFVKEGDVRSFPLSAVTLFDVTWFVSRPARTGIQRYLFELARNWPRQLDILPVIVDDESEMHIISFSIFTLMEDFFACADKDEVAKLSEDIKSYTGKRIAPVRLQDIEGIDGVFLPEVTYSETHIKFYIRALCKFPNKIFALTYDFIPWLSPNYFPHLDCSHYGVTGYLRLLRRIRNLGFPSTQTKNIFESRILRGFVDNPIVLGGGAEAFDGTENRPDGECPQFVFIGTVQSRKKHFLVLDVFEALWASGCNARLIFVGHAGDLSKDEEVRLRKLTENQPLFSWQTDAADDHVREILRHATALLYPSTEEGLGLPLLESLWAGIPAIVSSNLPALEFATGGYVAINVTHENLKGAVCSLLDPAFAAAKRREIDRTALPTWKSVAQAAADWIHATDGRPALGEATSPALRLARRFETAKAIQRLDRNDGAAFVEACFRELFGRSPTHDETVAWQNAWSHLSSTKLDLLLLMASSEEYVASHGSDGFRSWLYGVTLYQASPGLSCEAGL
jgi:glycosyltransferase involved in cell wall biosynthesis